MSAPERVQTIVIGGGQAGLSVGYHLARHGLPFIILEANQRIGDSWRARWDSLRLFTPARFDGLPGMPFPAGRHTFPTKNEMADFLASYASHFDLPVRTGTKVDRLSRQGEHFLIKAGDRTFEADNVVVAMATFQQPKVPAFARDLDPAIVQLHSSDYRNSAQLAGGNVLIVGAGNSGAEIAFEVAGAGRETWISGRDVGHVPFRVDGLASRLVLLRFLFRFVFHRVLTVDKPVGRRVRPKVLYVGGPLIRIKPRDLAEVGVQRVPRVTGVRGGRLRLTDDSVVDVANVIWCTGFQPGFSWIDLPVFDADGQPVHERGLVKAEPGLYFVGMHFLYALSSTMIHGVGRDAERIATAIARQAR